MIAQKSINGVAATVSAPNSLLENRETDLTTPIIYDNILAVVKTEH